MKVGYLPPVALQGILPVEPSKVTQIPVRSYDHVPSIEPAFRPILPIQGDRMSKLSVKEIQAVAVDIIRQNQGGIRYSALVNEISNRHPETPVNTIHGSVWNLETVRPSEVRKPSRGLYLAAETGEVPEPSPKPKVGESEFYESFGEWLRNELDEVTDVVALGGAGFRNKWGTPDVLGVYKPLASNLVKFPLEIVAGEVKVSGTESIVAFGQAAAYRLFAAKTYIAMPVDISDEDLGRLESLCLLFGVGLVLFRPDPKEPDYRVRVRAQRFSADMFYVNELADRLRSQDRETFERLFR